MSHLSIVASSHKRNRASEIELCKTNPNHENQQHDKNHVPVDQSALILESNNSIIKEETDRSGLDFTQPLDAKLQDESTVNINQINQENAEFQIQEDSEKNEIESEDDVVYSEEFNEESIGPPDE